MGGDERHSIELARRTFLASGIGAAGAVIANSARASDQPKIVAEDHWVKKGDVNLYVYRKRLAGGVAQPVVFLVHGSSFSGRGGFDLQVPGHPNYSLMDALAVSGFDVWTMDHENYGRSSRTKSNSPIMSGVEDLKAAMPLALTTTGATKVMMYGQSSGAIRAGVYAMEKPEVVDRIVLDAFTWTGEGAPEIMRRRKAVKDYIAHPSRKMDLRVFRGIFSRDDPSTFEPAVPEALAAYELQFDNTAPSGTYIDMAIHMPMVDPTKLKCPVGMIRAEHDGNATDPELLEFFGKLAYPDKQFFKIAGIAHVAVLGVNRHRVWHVMREFFTYPPTRHA